ncbi:MAG: cysteine desulfurase [Helicobacteraceae bacterium]|jgi:cysteine desulfurase/selenocysteine lyase|nr:cysteine desulfurase [Helicobacteraceae bacterium]
MTTLYSDWERPAGLPSASELAALAASYFPEFYKAENDAKTIKSASLPAFDAPLEKGISLGASPAYSPAVLPKEGGVDAKKTTAFSTHRVGRRTLEAIRADFPILSEKINGRELIWFDNGATTQKPSAVIDRLKTFYEHENSNVHRGAHELASRATDAYEEARAAAAKFIGAPSPDNIIFVRGTTEGINLAAQAYVKRLLKSGDEIVLTLLEHHANIVPWQLVAEETGALLRVAPVDDTGQIVLSEYARLFNSRTRFVAVAHVSNALGTIAPVAEMIQIAHSQGARVLVDGAQSVPHMPINVSDLDADFFVFSGHKIFAPTGIGVLYGKSEVLEAAKPYQGGGNMIADVTFERTLYRKAPEKFEAGTGNIADAAALSAALNYVSEIGIESVAAWEHELLNYGTKELSKVPGLKLIGTASQKAAILSFVLEGHSLEEVGSYLNKKGIAVRTGHHCAQPIHRRFNLEGTVRSSLAFYNAPEEIEAMAQALHELARR